MAIQRRLSAAMVFPIAFFVGLTDCRGPDGAAARHGGTHSDAYEPHGNLDEYIARQEDRKSVV